MPNDRYIKTPERNQIVIVQNAGYVTTLCYINRTAGTIYIKDRTGCITEIPPSNSHANTVYPYGCLVIQEINRAVSRNHENWKHQLHSLGEENCSVRHIARTGALAAEEIRTRSEIYSDITTFIVDLAGTSAHPASRYIEDYDITVTSGSDYNFALRSYHPGCVADQICESATEYSPELDVYIKYRSIQNTATQYSLWIIIDGKIFELKPSTSGKLNDGIYISYRDSKTGSPMAEYFKSIHDPRVATEGYAIYSSYEDARMALSESTSEAQRLKLEELRLKAEALSIAAEKARHETESIARKAKEEAARHENAMRELKAQRDKLRDEIHSRGIESGRKNTSDTIKYVTTAISFLFTITSLFFKK